MTASQTHPIPARKRRITRILQWFVGLMLCLLVIAVAVRSMLIHQMRLPRLTITQEDCVTSVSITPDGKTIFSGDGPAYDALPPPASGPRGAYVWSAADGRLIRRLPGFYWRSSGVTASPDGQDVIASGEAYRSGTSLTLFHTVVWNWKSGQKQWEIRGDLPLSYSPDGRIVGCESGIYAAASGKLIRRTSKNTAEDGQSEFTPDGKMLGLIDAGTVDPKTRMMRDDNGVSYYATTRLHFWRTDTGKEAKDFPFTRVRAFDIAHDGQWLLMVSDADGMTGGTDGSVVRRIDFNTGKVLWTRERRMNGPDADPNAILNSVAISPNGKYVVLASTNSQLIVLDAQTGRELFRPFIPPGTTIPSWAIPGGLAFSADGKTLVSRCGRRTLVWDAEALQ